MAEEVNNQIVDAAVDNQLLTLGTAIPQSMATANVVLAESVGMLMHNAITTYHNAKISQNAATTAACASILQASAARRPVEISDLIKSTNSSDLIKQATRLTETAVAMMDKEKPEYQANKKALMELATKIAATTKTNTTTSKKPARKKATSK
jgi:hypothetical protein